MKNLTNQAGNKLNLAGKLMDVQFGEGRTKETNQPYKNARVTIRVTQPVNGKEETSDIQVSMFATELTSTGKPNPACRCGEVLQGNCKPTDCPLFGKVCDPIHPVGACMVSDEGACAAYYHYGPSINLN